MLKETLIYIENFFTNYFTTKKQTNLNVLPGINIINILNKKLAKMLNLHHNTIKYKMWFISVSHPSPPVSS